MRLFRIAPERFGGDMTGAGARLFGGRWTPKGIPALYTSESPSLAALEVLVHQPMDLAPEPLVLLELDAPDDIKIEVVELGRLDKDWNAYPYRKSTVRIGERWLKRNVDLALKVPSAIMPFGRGWNYILNPMNPQFSRIKVISLEPFYFEGRLLRR